MGMAVRDAESHRRLNWQLETLAAIRDVPAVPCSAAG